MNIDQILEEKGSEIFKISSRASLPEAAALMKNKNVGALLVGEADVYEGIISERDIVYAFGETESERRLLTVADIMVRSEKLIVAEPDDHSKHVLAVMIQKGIRHMPVIDSGRIIGVLSIRDLVRSCIMRVSAKAHFLSDYLK
ncbi:MAG TPA: CBS domain-containing protein [Nitrospirae bacterium]|nr:CBS domain-containing protein [Nitrospirota bacterium]